MNVTEKRRIILGIVVTLAVLGGIATFVALRPAAPAYRTVGDGVALGPAAQHAAARTDVVVQIASGALATAAGNATLPSLGEATPSLLEQGLLDLTNADRASNGLPPVSFDPASLQVARIRTAAQIPDGPLSHYNILGDGALIGPIVFVQYLAESNILSERPMELFVSAMLGAVLGVPPAMWLERESGIVPHSFLSAILIASIEEPAKLLGVVWLLGIPALRFRMDGVIFGAAAGMGFAAIETLLYALARVETVESLVGVLWFRALLSPFTHGTWTAIVCATIWREHGAPLRKSAPRIAAALAVAVALHSLWDWSGLPLPFNFVWMATVGVASIATLRAILHRASLEEAQSVAALAPEAAQASNGAARLRCVGCGRLAPAGSHYCPRCGLALRR